MPVSIKSSLISRRRTFRPLIKYSDLPSLYNFRVTSTSSESTGNARCRTRPRRTTVSSFSTVESCTSSSEADSVDSVESADLEWDFNGASSTGLENTSDTAAHPIGLRTALPAKMTSTIALPRRLFALRSPRTHLIASTTLLLPQPLGPTIPMMGSSNRNSV